MIVGWIDEELELLDSSKLVVVETGIEEDGPGSELDVTVDCSDEELGSLGRLELELLVGTSDDDG